MNVVCSAINICDNVDNFIFLRYSYIFVILYLVQIDSFLCHEKMRESFKINHNGKSIRKDSLASFLKIVFTKSVRFEQDYLV